MGVEIMQKLPSAITRNKQSALILELYAGGDGLPSSSASLTLWEVWNFNQFREGFERFLSVYSRVLRHSDISHILHYWSHNSEITLRKGRWPGQCVSVVGIDP